MQSITLLTSVAMIFAAYLLGSISFAVIVSRFLKLEDPRTFGSGNPGATNVLRSGSKKAAALTLLFDLLKGYIPVLIAFWLAPQFAWPAYVIPAVALAAFLGHLFPLFFGFKGGKGVATAAGVLLAINPLMALAILAVWFFIAVATRYSSLAALIAAASAPILYQIFSKDRFQTEMLIAVSIISLLLMFRHKANIRKLIAGQESKIGQKKPKDEDS